MARMLPPDKAVRGLDLEGVRYDQRRGDGSFEVTSPRHEKLLRAAGCFPAALAVTQVRRGGCRICGSRVFNRIANRRCCAGCGEES